MARSKASKMQSTERKRTLLLRIQSLSALTTTLSTYYKFLVRRSALFPVTPTIRTELILNIEIHKRNTWNPYNIFMSLHVNELTSLSCKLSNYSYGPIQRQDTLRVQPERLLRETSDGFFVVVELMAFFMALMAFQLITKSSNTNYLCSSGRPVHVYIRYCDIDSTSLRWLQVSERNLHE